MGHYKSNLRDIEFNLFEVNGTAESLGKGPFAEVDEQTMRDILKQAEVVAVEEMASTFVTADRTPPVFDPKTNTVTMPQDFKASYWKVVESGFPKVDVPQELGGIGAPASLRWGIAEMFLGANPAMHLYLAGYPWSSILWHLGTPEQKRFAEIAIERDWGATMVLTEPDAGSDVGAGRTKAVEQPDGSWHITGVKRFISCGEHDLTENIYHLVLARPEGAGVGTKGLSLFLVPKFMVNLETGELGERNGAFATNVEHKMGMKVSTTCEMTFGAEQPAVGYLVGGVHDGIAQMFKIIEYARMLVGTKAISTLSTGYLHALDYAKIRVQGPDLAKMADKASPRVPIIAHPDVRRQLMLQKSYAEGLRALVFYTASWQDTIMRAEAGEDGLDLARAKAVNDLLLPIVKGVGSERAYEILAQSLQVFGGSGYLQDYPLEQYIRDAKIDTLYEGTTAIQGLDFFFRKMVRDKFQAITYLGEQIQATATAAPAGDVFKAERKLLGKALSDVQAMITTLGFWAQAAHQGDAAMIYKVGLNTTRLLLSAGDLIIGWLLLRQAEVAKAALDAGAAAKDVPFYEGKVASARWFAQNRLPLLTAEKNVCEHTDDDVMQLPIEAF